MQSAADGSNRQQSTAFGSKMKPKGNKETRARQGRAEAPVRVVVALRMAGIAGQDKLSGIFEHMRAERRWQLMIYRTRHEFTAETVRLELARGACGFLVGIPGTDDALSVLASSTAPTVLLNVSGGGIGRRTDRIAFVMSDSRAVGREAARVLLSQGIYNGFGYAGYTSDDQWSRERGRHFLSALAESGYRASVFDRGHFGAGIDDKAQTLAWLKSLPKPCGILAACDDRAFELLDICREAGIAVPGEIGMLGVNNDPILCENSEPRLSSIQPDFASEGKMAAGILERIMAGDDSFPQGRTFSVGIRAAVERESTAPVSDSGYLVQRALAWMRKEAVHGIGVAAVARRFSVSPSLLQMRFREIRGKGVYATLLDIRLGEVKRLLRETSRPIADITFDCGWENPEPPKSLFKRRFGVSMREWRAGREAKWYN